jgi:phosphatidylserine decarboxylase
MGSAARWRIPRPISRAAVAAYVRYFDVETHDLEPDSLDRGFDSFNEFFTRRLRDGARPIAESDGVLVSPCDGTLRESSPIEDGARLIAKGHDYSLGELLADDDLAQRFRGGLQTTIYLHPRDYHRVHTPCDGRVVGLTLVPGRLLPVTDASLTREPRVFALNERMVHVLETPHGLVAAIMIAAFGVGNMTCAYREVETHPHELTRVDVEGVELDKGDELGVFNLGSTVVLLTQPGVRLASSVRPGRVLFGEPLLEATPS